MYMLGLIAFIIAVVVVAAVAAGHIRLKAAIGRLPRKRHAAIRILCGSLGGAILVAVALGTWLEVRSHYAEHVLGETITVHVPARPAPPLPVVPEGEREVEIDKARLLMHVVVVDCSLSELNPRYYPSPDSEPSAFQPVRADEFEINWPEDRGRTCKKNFKLNRFKVKYNFRIQSLYCYEAGPDKPKALHVTGRVHFSRDSFYSSGSSSKSLHQTAGYLAPLLRRQNHPLSIAPGTGQDLHTFYFLTRVAEDDPLREISLAQFIQSRMEEMRAAMPVTKRYFTYPVPLRSPLRSLALTTHIGTVSLLLLAAAALLSQLFGRRWLAFAGILAAVMLYVAVLDGAALDAHLSRLTDTEAPLVTRLVACDQARYTFFYRKTAFKEVEAVADDETAPEELRNLTRSVAGFLKER